MKLSSLQKGLVAHYPLDKESLQSATVFADKTPNENVGTSANTPVFTTDRMGQSDRAMSFNGTSDYVDCGNDSSLDFGIDDFSISAWVKTDDTTLNNTIVAKLSITSWKGFALEIDADRIELYMNGAHGLFASSPLINDDVWHHIVVKRVGHGISLYVDGAFIETRTRAAYAENVNISDNLLIGHNSYTADWYLPGSIADVRIYNRALSEPEITMLYEQYRSKLSVGSLQKGLVLDMPLKSKYMKSATLMTDRTPYCLSPDTRGFFGSGFIRADEVKIGETILQNNGKLETIMNIIPSHFEGNLIKIKARGVPAIKLTPPHKVLVVDGDKISLTRKSRNSQKTRNKKIEDYDFISKWVEAKDLNVGDYLTIPKPRLEEKEQIIQPMKHLFVKDYIMDDFAKGITPDELIENGKYGTVLEETIKTYYIRFKNGTKSIRDTKYFEPQVFDEEWAEIFGWWGAEGSLGTHPDRGRWDVVFSLGYHEMEEAKRIQDLLYKKTGKTANINAHDSIITITAHNKSLVKFLQENFGRGSINKKLPSLLLNAPNNVVRAFLVAYNKGDGCITGGNTQGYYDTVRFETSSPALVKDVSVLLMKLGVCPNIVNMNTKGFCEIKGQISNQNPAWDIRISGKDVLVLYPDIEVSKKNVEIYLQDENNFYVRISKLELESYEGTVYDFETKTHTLGMPFIIHNSNDGTNHGGDVDTDHTTFVSVNDDYVRIPYSESLSLTTAMTAMVWVRGGSQGSRGVLERWDQEDECAYAIRSIACSTQLQIRLSATGETDDKRYNSSVSVLDNTWHLVGFTFAAETLKLYIDGVEDTETLKLYDDVITTIHHSTADATLGCYLDANIPKSYFTGDISGAKIWNRALSGEEVLLLYEKGR